MSFAPDIVITGDEQHNEVYKTGSKLIAPHMELNGRKPDGSRKAHKNLVLGIRLLNAMTAYNPANWSAFWVKGKGYQALGDPVAANGEFKRAFDLEKSNPDVAREYAISCLDLGLADEGVMAAVHAIGVDPVDAGLHANLAVAFLIAGRLSDAQDSIERALEIRPDDSISLAVQHIIDEVVQGRRSQPRRSADLYTKI